MFTTISVMSFATQNVDHRVPHFLNLVQRNTLDLENGLLLMLYLPSYSHLSILTAACTTEQNVSRTKQMAMGSQSHHPLTEINLIFYSGKSQDIIVRINILATTLNITWRVAEQQDRRFEQGRPMRKLVLVCKLPKINIVEVSDRLRCFSNLSHRLDLLWTNLRRCRRFHHVSHLHHLVFFFSFYSPY